MWRRKIPSDLQLLHYDSAWHAAPQDENRGEETKEGHKVATC